MEGAVNPASVSSARRSDEVISTTVAAPDRQRRSGDCRERSTGPAAGSRQPRRDVLRAGSGSTPRLGAGSMRRQVRCRPFLPSLPTLPAPYEKALPAPRPRSAARTPSSSRRPDRPAQPDQRRGSGPARTDAGRCARRRLLDAETPCTAPPSTSSSSARGLRVRETAAGEEHERRIHHLDGNTLVDPLLWRRELLRTRRPTRGRSPLAR